MVLQLVPLEIFRPFAYFLILKPRLPDLSLLGHLESRLACCPRALCAVHCANGYVPIRISIAITIYLSIQSGVRICIDRTITEHSIVL